MRRRRERRWRGRRLRSGRRWSQRHRGRRRGDGTSWRGAHRARLRSVRLLRLVCFLDDSEEHPELGNVSEPLPRLRIEADLVVPADLPLDDPPLQIGQLPEGEDVSVPLPDLPLAFVAGPRRGGMRAVRSVRSVGEHFLLMRTALNGLCRGPPPDPEDVTAAGALDRHPGLGDARVVELVLGLAPLATDVHVREASRIQRAENNRSGYGGPTLCPHPVARTDRRAPDGKIDRSAPPPTLEHPSGYSVLPASAGWLEVSNDDGGTKAASGEGDPVSPGDLPPEARALGQKARVERCRAARNRRCFRIGVLTDRVDLGGHVRSGGSHRPRVPECDRSRGTPDRAGPPGHLRCVRLRPPGGGFVRCRGNLRRPHSQALAPDRLARPAYAEHHRAGAARFRW